MAATGKDAYGMLTGRLTQAIPEVMKTSKEGFTKDEWLSMEVKGKPLYYEHNRKHQLGELVSNWVDSEGWCGVNAVMYKSHPEVKEIYSGVVEGKLNALSVGFWSDNPKEGPIRYKKFVEASVTK